MSRPPRVLRGRITVAVALLLLAFPALLAAQTTPPGGPAGAEPSPAARPALADAPKAETVAIKRLLASPSWVKRALLTMRLERYACGQSRALLEQLSGDPVWQVRAYAVRCLGRRRDRGEAPRLAKELEPRVIRAALRWGFPLDPERLARGVERLADAPRLDDRLLAVELGAASGNEDLQALARETARKIILRMNRAEAGALSTRLARLTGARGLHRPSEWQRWLTKTGRGLSLRSGIVEDPGAALSRIARLEPERFAALDAYIEDLAGRDLDIAICLDCTASMSGELSAAQAGVDDLILFVGDLVRSLRFGLVGYRDRHDRFTTRAWDFTDDVEEARRRLWQLTAEGGGDRREAVHPALKLAYTRLAWEPEHVMVLVLVGDAPPHVGLGSKCVGLAARAGAAGLTTHVIQTEDRSVEHFQEIAEAGEGRWVTLAEDETLIPEIAGLTVGGAFAGEFREFFAAYLDLCR